MAKQKLIFVLIACLSLVAIGGGTLPPKPIPSITSPPRELLRGLTDAEKQDAIDKWFADQHLKERIARDEYLAERERQAMKNELRVNEAQWRIIEPKYERQIRLMKDTGARSSSGNSKDLGHHWIKPTEYKPGKPKIAVELSEAYRNVDKLVDLLRREDTTDEELRKQIDALQQAREKARKERPKAKQELAATLMTPRQEAVFLLLGHID